MKKTTPGDWRKLAKLALVAGVSAAIFYGRKSSMKKLEATKANPSIHQYLNRLVEFFDMTNIDKAQDEFLTMVDFGLYPHEAFEIITYSPE